MKRFFAVLLCLALLTGLLPALAQMDAAPYSLADVEGYVRVALDRESGEWSWSEPRFDAMLDSIRAGEAKSGIKDGFVIWQLRMSGNNCTATLRPEMELYYVANGSLGVQAVSVLVGSTRYDIAVQGVNGSIGSCHAEKIIVPLESFAMAEEIAAAQEIGIVLHGAQDVYATSVSASDSEKTVRARMERASLACDAMFETGLYALVENYGLWEASCTEWETSLGCEPQWSAVECEELAFVCMGEKGDDVEALQALLSEAGFYFGEEEKEFGEKTRAAVLRAQEYYGLLGTGSADAALIACLNGEAPLEQASEPPETAADTLAGLEIGMESCWLARRVNPSANAGGSAVVNCSDADNCFAVFAGQICNATAEEISLGWQLTAELCVNGTARYACTLRAECDNGQNFTGTLLPLAETRLIVLAEAPAQALQGAQSLALSFQYGSETLEYDLLS